MSDIVLRQRIVMVSGALIVLLALGAALLPLSDTLAPRVVIGTMLLAAGALELLSALMLQAHRPAMSIAGGATILAALRLLLDPRAGFFPVLNLVILWLVVRAAALAFAAWRSKDPLQSWLIFSSAADFLLAVGLLAGMPIAYLVVGLFGPTQPIVGTFAWVFALSFITTGAALIATSRLEFRQPD